LVVVTSAAAVVRLALKATLHSRLQMQQRRPFDIQRTARAGEIAM
jgi:hypothetical protein